MLETFKANFVIFIFILLIGALGYWAIKDIKSSTDSFVAQNIKEDDVRPVITSPIEEDKEETEDPVEDSTPEVSSPVENPKEEVQEEKPQTSNDEDSELISNLQDLIDDKILMKKGSKGTRVGTVQKFLIRYGVSMKVDNDYGDTTVNAVKKFQTEQKLSADGQTGEGTYKKMIEWLQNN